MRKRKGYKWLRTVFKLVCAAVILLLIWILYTGWTIRHFPQKEVSAADVGIVLGASIRNDKPTPGLKERLDLAYRLYAEGKYPRLIVTGGLDGNGSKLTEAEGMRDYLMEKGVPENKIYLENEARSTFENLVFSKSIMDKNGWHSAVVVTHRYHGARAENIAGFIGLEPVSVATTESKVLNMSYHTARETLAFSKWTADKWLIRLGLK